MTVRLIFVSRIKKVASNYDFIRQFMKAKQKLWVWGELDEVYGLRKVVSSFKVK